MRTSARITGAAAAMLAAALLVSGCGSGSDSGDKNDKPADQAQTGGTEGGDGGSGDGPDAKPGTVQGIWTAKVDGKDVVLTVVGDGVSMVRDETICSGRLTDAGKPTLTLKCPGGQGEDRTNGSVDKVEAKSMTVSWNGGDTDTFVKTAEAPSDIPTDLGDLEKLIPQG
ncbi:hypothetical protein [Streptomyces alkaliterrae]|uniref:Lipoprotein n=1 Tax=Streptomyces alkaliterrae TaxID=2213162 RepID=A0A5P0YUP4_9ACTN|nr:hypothetical protein [Streptomyces alkaliterrae]MBB1254263.1 hypothetical protein [Streptomyces alkaliterrae]MBB1259614.1 hypothetical protein [Streptomyces alkaliterrae]MQS03182.1 hypothetical protein [Streptomyces alkaliterrae]